MEQALEKLKILLEKADAESIAKLTDDIEKALDKAENREIKLKSAYAVGLNDDPGNYLSIDFKIG